MRLGRTGCTTDAITTGTAAEEDDPITGIGIQSLYCATGSGAHNGTYLHTLCNIVGMIDLMNMQDRSGYHKKNNHEPLHEPVSSGAAYLPWCP